MLYELKDETFFEDIKNNIWFVIVGISTCYYCAQTAENFENLSNNINNNSIKFGRILQDDTNEVALKFNIHTYPTVMVFKDGIAIYTYEKLKYMPDIFIETSLESIYQIISSKNIDNISETVINELKIEIDNSIEKLINLYELKDHFYRYYNFKNNKTTDIVILNKSNIKNKFIFNNDIQKIIVEDDITYIPKKMFYSCKNLNTVVLSKSVNIIETGAFMLCKNLKNINLNPNMIIKSHAFYGCIYIKKANYLNLNLTFEQDSMYD